MPSTSPKLWIIATPLGNLGDFSPRAKETIEAADVILAEDTRRAMRLCSACGISPKKILSFFEHNETERQKEIFDLFDNGSNIALITDAGTPLMADPGYRLVRACRQKQIPVSPIPGPCAVTTALSIAGIPPFPYTFLGFLPRDAAGKRKLFGAFLNLPSTLVFFDRADRVGQSLHLAHDVLGPREFAICREMTKEFEETILGRLDEVEKYLPDSILGEITAIIGPPERISVTPQEDVMKLLRERMKTPGKPKAMIQEILSQSTGWSAKELYSLYNRIKADANIPLAFVSDTNRKN